MIEAVHASYTGSRELPEIYQSLEEALRLSMPDYKEEDLRKIRLFTQTELTLINNMAMVLYKQGKDVQAVEMLQCLIRYLEQEHADAEVTSKKYPMLLCNLAKMLDRQHRYQEVLELCEKGIRFDNRYARSVGLPEFYYYKACAYRTLERYAESKENYEYAVMLYQVTGKPSQAQQLRDEKDDFFRNSRK